MEFSQMALGAFLGQLSITHAASDGTAKTPDAILGEMTAKFSGLTTQIATLTTERDAANLAKKGLEAEKVTLTGQVEELTAKTKGLPAGKPKTTTLKEGDAAEKDKEEDELPSLRWLREQHSL